MDGIKKGIIKVLAGLILLVVPILLIFPGMPLASWGKALLEFIKGSITILVLLSGIALIVAGIFEIKD